MKRPTSSVRRYGPELGEPTEPVTFVVPGSPVSVNAAYRRRGNGPGLFKTPEAKEWQGLVELFGRIAMDGHAPISGPVSVTLTVYDPKPRKDSDAGTKLSFDALQSIVIRNDRQIRDHHVIPEWAEEPSVRFTVMKIDENG